MDQVRQELNNTVLAKSNRAESPLSALYYQRDLLDSLRQLHSLNRILTAAQVKLSALMNLKPGTPYTFDVIDVPLEAPSLVLGDLETLEKVALLQRPELREEAYTARISHRDVRSEYLRILPGIDLRTALNHDSNSFAAEESWWSWGTSITKNLFEVINAPKSIARAKSELSVAEFRRYAFSIAIMSQVHISMAGYAQAVNEYTTTSDLFDVELAIKQATLANIRAGSGSKRDRIRAELQALLAEVRRDVAFADMRASVGRVAISLGTDPLPVTLEGDDLNDVAAALKQIDESWYTDALKHVKSSVRDIKVKT